MNKREETQKKRAAALWIFDAEYRCLYGRISGMDEAGRGPLAGPVYAACVAFLPGHQPITGVNDSKKLSEKVREVLGPKIRKEALCYGIGSASVDEIEEYNILEATRMAMKRAYERMQYPSYLLLDGMDPQCFSLDGSCIVRGDGKSYHIAAASILAKVARDQEMKQLAELYPGYGLQTHKGYGTKAHRDAIVALGPSPVHRRSFLKWLTL